MMMCMFVSNSFHMNFKVLRYFLMYLCCCDTKLLDNVLKNVADFKGQMQQNWIHLDFKLK